MNSFLLCLSTIPFLLVAQEIPKGAYSGPDDLQATLYSGADTTPCPACLAASPEGDVYVGVDLLGSLGKGPGKGRIVKLRDADNDGVADHHTVYAEIDNVRGIIPLGDKLIVLHTVIPPEVGKLTGMHLSELVDADGDGVADGPPRRLVRDISVARHNQARGADHTTNGIRLGIDGWVYIAVGDFGMVGATGVDGRVVTMLGGGILRVRPDGTEMEVYTHGLRNIYDVAVDPFLNIFTRGNTNDGGGWNIRFIHQIQSGEYGYPVLFKHFTEEIIPALADLGGGSGTGALFFDEPGWPAAYSKVPMMCDWGRSQLVIHRVAPDGASFTQEAEQFIKLHQITDADVDGSGRLYLGAWQGAGFKGDPSRGFVARVVPREGWTYRPFPNLAELEAPALVALLRSPSAVTRLATQRELLRRGDRDPADAVAEIALDPHADLEGRVAAVFTLKQMLGVDARPVLLRIAGDATVREWALRALADRIPENKGLTLDPFVAALDDPDPRTRVAAAVALGRIGDPAAAPSLLKVATPPGTGETDTEEPEPPTYASHLVKKKQEVEIDVDITGFKTLALMVHEGGDGTGNDHGAWYEPVLVRADSSELKLTELEWKSARQGWGGTRIDRSCNNKPLRTAKGADVPFGIGTHSASVIEYELPEPFARFRARGGISDSAGGRGTVGFAVHDKPVALVAKPNEGPHATPNSAVVLPHVAVRALVALGAEEACLYAIDGPRRAGALWALRHMHSTTVAETLARKHREGDAATRAAILPVLVRLYQREAPYDGSWWWGTRPDTHGPYYKTQTWEGSGTIAAALREAWETGGDRARIARLFAQHRVSIDGVDLSKAVAATKPEEPGVDLSKIDTSVGEVGRMSVEDVIVALGKIKGKPAQGQRIFTRQGCVACHTLTADEPLKGPYMGQVGAILKRDDIAMSILRPNAAISQGFKTVMVTTRDGEGVAGFVSARSADEIEMRDVAGQVHRVKTADIKEEKELEISMMPPGLANPLSLQEFASLVDFLAQQKK